MEVSPMPRPKGSKNKPKTAKATVDLLHRLPKSSPQRKPLPPKLHPSLRISMR